MTDWTMNGYYMDSAEAYLQAAHEMRSWHGASVRLVSPQNRAKYRQQVQAGFGFYLDMYLNPADGGPRDETLGVPGSRDKVTGGTT